MSKVKFHFLCVLFCVLIVSCTKTDNEHPITEPEGVEIININSYTDRISIGWKPLSATTQYEVRYSLDRNMSDAIVLESNTISVQVDDLAINQDYFWQIRGFVSGSWSKWSEIKRIATASFETSVTTYNILGIEHDPNIEPEYAWNLRRDAVRDIILQPNNNPDIIGVQECRLQYEDVVERLSEFYDSHISEREISARAIFWKRDKFELVSFDDNIDIFGSRVEEGHRIQRWITQVRLREKTTGKELFVYNIHLPSGNSGTLQSIRGIGAETVANHAKILSEQHGIPTLIVGDLNNYTEPYIDGFPPSPIVFRENGIIDAFDIALQKVNNNYGTQINRGSSTARVDNNRRIHLDYILGYPRDLMAVVEHAIIINFLGASSTQLERPVPSDHHPVRAVVHLSY